MLSLLGRKAYLASSAGKPALCGNMLLSMIFFCKGIFQIASILGQFGFCSGQDCPDQIVGRPVVPVRFTKIYLSLI